MYRCQFDAYGNLVEEETATHWETGERLISFRNPLRFQGQYEDEESGLFYNLNRYYQPELGRYITPDPVGLTGGLNQYAYVGNSPTQWIDPLGLFRGLDESDSVFTGAREIKTTEDYYKFEKEANDYYEAVRNSDHSDISAISQHTGWPEYRVARVKDHVFIDDTHILREGRIDRFDPDIEIADAWRRLQQGNHTEMDIKLLNHEYFESKFEKIFKTNYKTSHTKTVESGRDWNP
ncbi:RHS repeat-associated core domain-containing protein [Salmonella enterica]|nr:RHS repeat-associated core domain-containing protein [Salmonella enterica]EBG4968566.1 RHS repeat-associated core domain-containing protein [Salmonella enterica subsp. enterica serovar Agoueve]EDT8873484.1 RHS repeat-associated core domain-containing protein [Salmonella enterica subsp. enterica]HAU7009510.1 RHS repeat-associated core domain-containing protein [Salmonella enterica subsp. enterica serovar Berta]EAP7980129.1 RHS repeat-associated core domain-containing protein [Salmonella enter